MTGFSGEGQEANADAFIQAALEFYGEKGQLDATPVPSALERDRDPLLANSPLRFPGKLAFDADSSRIFISDSNNNRCAILAYGFKILLLLSHIESTKSSCLIDFVANFYFHGTWVLQYRGPRRQWQVPGSGWRQRIGSTRRLL